MSLPLDCVPCVLRASLEASRRTTADVKIHERIMCEALKLASLEAVDSAPLFYQHIHHVLHDLTGIRDPYREAKRRFNALALALLPQFRAELAVSEDPLAYAVRLASAANVIDLGAYSHLTEEDVRASFRKVLSEPFSGDLGVFRESVRAAEHILYLADNAGEIVFDRLLIEQLPAKRITLAVRGGFALNDATLEDVVVAGLDRIVEVVDNGSDAPGTVLEDCSPAFRALFKQADLIIAKGQGNFETLSATAADIFFLLKVKCAVAAEHTGLSVGTQALIASMRRPSLETEAGTK